MLVSFPIAFLVGGIGFDVLSRVFSIEAFYTTSYHCLIAGVVTGVLAAIPGLIDYTSVIRSGTRAHKIATYHMLVNGSALALFVYSLVTRPDFVNSSINSMLPAYFSLLLLVVGGWLGGTLVYEERIGVNDDLVEPSKGPDTRWKGAPGEYGIAAHR